MRSLAFIISFLVFNGLMYFGLRNKNRRILKAPMDYSPKKKDGNIMEFISLSITDFLVKESLKAMNISMI